MKEVKYFEREVKEGKITIIHRKRIPKYIWNILSHYANSCFGGEKNILKRRCIHCFDCISFGLLYLETNRFYESNLKKHNLVECNLWGEFIRRGDQKYLYSADDIFRKFLMSTIAKGYLNCSMALNQSKIIRLANWLIKLTPEEMQDFRNAFFTHAEFKSPTLINELEFKLIKNKTQS